MKTETITTQQGAGHGVQGRPARSDVRALREPSLNGKPVREAGSGGLQTEREREDFSKILTFLFQARAGYGYRLVNLTEAAKKLGLLKRYLADDESECGPGDEQMAMEALCARHEREVMSNGLFLHQQTNADGVHYHVQSIVEEDESHERRELDQDHGASAEARAFEREWGGAGADGAGARESTEAVAGESRDGGGMEAVGGGASEKGFVLTGELPPAAPFDQGMLLIARFQKLYRAHDMAHAIEAIQGAWMPRVHATLRRRRAVTYMAYMELRADQGSETAKQWVKEGPIFLTKEERRMAA